jgi:hypothetical protein
MTKTLVVRSRLGQAASEALGPSTASERLVELRALDVQRAPKVGDEASGAIGNCGGIAGDSIGNWRWPAPRALPDCSRHPSMEVAAEEHQGKEKMLHQQSRPAAVVDQDEGQGLRHRGRRRACAMPGPSLSMD